MERLAHLGSPVRQEPVRQEPVQQMERLLKAQLALEEQWWSFRPFRY